MDLFGIEVKNTAGVVVMRSKNLRAVLRYAGVSPVVKVRAMPCPSNPYNGKLYVEYANGATTSAHFACHTVLLEWLGNRHSWSGAAWDVDAPPAKHLDQRSIYALERLNKKGLY